MRNRNGWLGLGAMMALACGGNVDMGGRGDGSGFIDAPTAVALQNPAVPQTLYEDDTRVYGFTADETTLYALVQTEDDAGQLVSCPLDRCQSERTLLTRGAASRVSQHYGTPMWIVGDWIFWSYGPQSPAAGIGPQSPADGIAACPKTGCDSPLRTMSGNAFALAGDGDYAYWIDLRGWLNRWNPDVAGPEPLRQVSELGASGLAVAGDHVYFVVGAIVNRDAVWRVRKDGSEAAELVANGDHVSSVAITDDTLYYAVELLGGFIASCPLSGCEGSDTALVSNQRYPFSLQVVGTEAFWMTRVVVPEPEQGGQGQRGALTSCALPECRTVRSWISGFYTPGSYTPGRSFIEEYDAGQVFVITSQFVLWRENRGGIGSALRRLPR